MVEIFYILAKTVAISLELVSIGMIVRMLIPFFLDPNESRLYARAFFLTEPFIIPVRAAMVRLNIGQDSPIDWAFSIAYILIWLLKNLLPAI